MFGIDKNQKLDYKFETTSLDDFELKLKFKPKGYIMRLFIRLAQSGIKKQTGVDAKAERLHEILDGLVLPDGYNALIHTSCKPALKNIYAEVLKDGIQVLHDKVVKVTFYKNLENISTIAHDDYYGEVLIKGMFTKKK